MSLYGKDWKNVARKVKEKANWHCSKCGVRCIAPGTDVTGLTPSERRSLTLQVHHLNRKPWDNREENLIAVCAPCHLNYHRFGHGNVSPGQLEFLS